jgi:hypothetical protein
MENDRNLVEEGEGSKELLAMHADFIAVCDFAKEDVDWFEQHDSFRPEKDPQLEQEIKDRVAQLFSKIDSHAQTLHPNDPRQQKVSRIYILLLKAALEPGPQELWKTLNAEIDKTLVELFGDDHKSRDFFLIDLWKVGAHTAMQKVLDMFESEEFSDVMKMLEQLDLSSAISQVRSGEFSGFPIEPLKDLNAAIENIYPTSTEAAKTLHNFGYDRPASDSAMTENPFYGLFGKVDISNPKSKAMLMIGENFLHALDNCFDFHIFGSMQWVLASCKGKDLEDVPQISAVDLLSKVYPSVAILFKSFQNQILGISPSETCSLPAQSAHLINLFNQRFLWKNELPVQPLKFEASFGNPEINHSDPNSILLSIWEVLKNPMRDGKVDVENIGEQYSQENPYISVVFDEATVDGKEVVTVEIVDRGAPINLIAIIQKIIDKRSDLLGYESRDITMRDLFKGIDNIGDLLSLLSSRNMSIPVGDSSAISTGTGLHSAIELIRANKGDLFCANLTEEQGGGVSFMLVFPKEGKESPFTIGDLDLTGKQCATMSHDFAQKIATYAQFENQFRVLADKEDKVEPQLEKVRDAVLLTLLMAAMARPTSPAARFLDRS